MSDIEKNVKNINTIMYNDKYYKKFKAGNLFEYYYQTYEDYVKIKCFNNDIILFSKYKFHTNNKILDKQMSKLNYENILNVFETENGFFYIYKNKISKLNFLYKKSEEILQLCTLNQISEINFTVSKSGNLCIFFDGKFLNFFHKHETKKIYIEHTQKMICSTLIKISDDNSIIVLMINNYFIVVWNLQNNNLQNITYGKSVNYCIEKNNDIVVLCKDGNVYKYKNGKQYKINFVFEMTKNIYTDALFFLDGKILCLVTKNKKHKNKILFISLNNTDDYKLLEFKYLEYCISTDLNYFIKLNSTGIIEIINLYFLKNKQQIISNFLLGNIPSNNSLNSFFENCLYDRNLLNLIIDFIPYF